MFIFTIIHRDVSPYHEMFLQVVVARNQSETLLFEGAVEIDDNYICNTG